MPIAGCAVARQAAALAEVAGLATELPCAEVDTAVAIEIGEVAEPALRIDRTDVGTRKDRGDSRIDAIRPGDADTEALARAASSQMDDVGPAVLVDVHQLHELAARDARHRGADAHAGARVDVDQQGVTVLAVLPPEQIGQAVAVDVGRCRSAKEVGEPLGRLGFAPEVLAEHDLRWRSGSGRHDLPDHQPVAMKRMHIAPVPDPEAALNRGGDHPQPLGVGRGCGDVERRLDRPALRRWRAARPRARVGEGLANSQQQIGAPIGIEVDRLWRAPTAGVGVRKREPAAAELPLRQLGIVHDGLAALLARVPLEPRLIGRGESVARPVALHQLHFQDVVLARARRRRIEHIGQTIAVHVGKLRQRLVAAGQRHATGRIGRPTRAVRQQIDRLVEDLLAADPAARRIDPPTDRPAVVAGDHQIVATIAVVVDQEPGVVETLRVGSQAAGVELPTTVVTKVAGAVQPTELGPDPLGAGRETGRARAGLRRAGVEPHEIQPPVAVDITQLGRLELCRVREGAFAAANEARLCLGVGEHRGAIADRTAETIAALCERGQQAVSGTRTADLVGQTIVADVGASRARGDRVQIARTPHRHTGLPSHSLFRRWEREMVEQHFGEGFLVAGRSLLPLEADLAGIANAREQLLAGDLVRHIRVVDVVAERVHAARERKGQDRCVVGRQHAVTGVASKCGIRTLDGLRGRRQERQAVHRDAVAVPCRGAVLALHHEVVEAIGRVDVVGADARELIELGAELRRRPGVAAGHQQQTLPIEAVAVALIERQRRAARQRRSRIAVLTGLPATHDRRRTGHRPTATEHAQPALRGVGHSQLRYDATTPGHSGQRDGIGSRTGLVDPERAGRSAHTVRFRCDGGWNRVGRLLGQHAAGNRDDDVRARHGNTNTGRIAVVQRTRRQAERLGRRAGRPVRRVPVGQALWSRHQARRERNAIAQKLDLRHRAIRIARVDGERRGAADVHDAAVGRGHQSHHRCLIGRVRRGGHGDQRFSRQHAGARDRPEHVVSGHREARHGPADRWEVRHERRTRRGLEGHEARRTRALDLEVDRNARRAAVVRGHVRHQRQPSGGSHCHRVAVAGGFEADCQRLRAGEVELEPVEVVVRLHDRVVESDPHVGAESAWKHTQDPVLDLGIAGAGR